MITPEYVAAPRRRLPRAEREQQLLDVAHRLFSERGFHAVSMDEVAIAAGVTKPVLYDHFGSKDGLIVACIRQAGQALAEEIGRAIVGAEEPSALLEAGFRGFFAFVESYGTSWFMLLGESSLGRDAADEVEAIRREQASFVAGRLAASIPGAEATAVAAYSEAVIGACERIALWRRGHPDVSAETATRYLMGLLWGGLRSLSESVA